MRGDVLPPKRQAVVDRLRRRIEQYRRHHNATLPRHEAAANAIYEEQHQDTLMLKQRYLESKAKKAKKNDHKTVKDSSSAGSSTSAAADAQKNLLGKFNKPVLSEGLESALESGSADVGHHEKDQRSCKASRSSASTPDQPQDAHNIQKQQLQSIPGFDCIKSGMLQSSNQIRHPNPTPEPPANVSAGGIKLEHDIEAALCSGNSANGVSRVQQDSAASNEQPPESSANGEQFPDSFPNLAFPEDSSEVWVDNPEILRHLIDDITNPSDLMTDFNFSYGVDNLKDSPGEGKDNNGAIMEPSEKRSQQPASQTSASGFDPRVSNPLDVMTRTTGCLSPNFSGSVQSSGQFQSPDLGGLDFKLAEPSLAAQTLKQMAEQHQQHKQTRDKHSLGLPPLKRSFADTYDSNVGSMRSNAFDAAPSAMPKVLPTTSSIYSGMSYNPQSTMAATFHIDASAKAANVLGLPAFSKLETNAYAVARGQHRCQTSQPLPRMPVQEQQSTSATKTGRFPGSADEKAAFFSNFKASLAQFNETSSPSPPLTKSPSQFNKRMTPSPLSQQGQLMMGHRQVQGSQTPLQPQKEHKEISPLNISSNPSYAEALAFSSAVVHTPSMSYFQRQTTQQKTQQSKAINFRYTDIASHSPVSTAAISEGRQHSMIQNKPVMSISSQPFQNFTKVTTGGMQRNLQNVVHSAAPVGMPQAMVQRFVNPAARLQMGSKATPFASQPPSTQFVINQPGFNLPNVATIRGGILHASSVATMSHGSPVFQHKPLYTSAPQRSPVNVEWRQTTTQQPCYQQRPQGTVARMNVPFVSQTMQRGAGPQQRVPFQPSVPQSLAQPLPQLQIPQRSAVQSGGTFSPSLTSSISDFSLEFLDSIENSDSDLLNFDPVNSNFGILDDVLGGK